MPINYSSIPIEKNKKQRDELKRERSAASELIGNAVDWNAKHVILQCTGSEPKIITLFRIDA